MVVEYYCHINVDLQFDFAIHGCGRVLGQLICSCWLVSCQSFCPSTDTATTNPIRCPFGCVAVPLPPECRSIWPNFFCFSVSVWRSGENSQPTPSAWLLVSFVGMIPILTKKSRNGKHLYVMGWEFHIRRWCLLEVKYICNCITYITKMCNI